MTWFQFSHPYDEDDKGEGSECSQDQVEEPPADQADPGSSYNDDLPVTNEKRFSELFFSRLEKLEEGRVDPARQRWLFTQECRLLFLSFWMTDKQNWLAELNKDQLDFLRFLLTENTPPPVNSV
jgi:hypothetical protein